MANLILNGSTSGSVTISSPAVSGTTTLTLPATSGTVLTNGINTNFPAGSVLQVVQTVKSDTYSTTSSTFNDVTGLSVSITPSSSSNKILVFVDAALGVTNAAYGAQLRLLRNSTAIYIGDAAGSRDRSMMQLAGDISGSQYQVIRTNGQYLDSPATTSSVTYKVQINSGNNSSTSYINRTVYDNDSVGIGRFASSITVMEVKG